MYLVSSEKNAVQKELIYTDTNPTKGSMSQMSEPGACVTKLKSSLFPSIANFINRKFHFTFKNIEVIT